MHYEFFSQRRSTEKRSKSLGLVSVEVTIAHRGLVEGFGEICIEIREKLRIQCAGNDAEAIAFNEAQPIERLTGAHEMHSGSIVSVR